MHLEKENYYKICSKKEKSSTVRKSIVLFCPREKGLEAAIVSCSKEKCPEIYDQSPWKIRVRKFIFNKVAVFRSVTLLKMKSVTDILEKYWQEIQLATFKSRTEDAVLISEGSMRGGYQRNN